MAKINFSDKTNNKVSALPEINKVTAENINEIKNSVNELYDLRNETVRVDTENQKVAVFEGSNERGSQIKIENTDATNGAVAFIDVRNDNIGIGGNEGYSNDNLNINTENDNVGIGTRTPLSKLHIKGDDTILKLDGKFANSDTGIEFSKVGNNKANIKVINENNTLVLSAQNGNGNSESRIQFKTSENGSETSIEAMRIHGNGQIVIGNPTQIPTTKKLYVGGEIHIAGQENKFDGSLSVNGRVDADEFKLKGLNAAPTSSTDTGVNGEIRITSDYIYICVANNVWKRAALTTW